MAPMRENLHRFLSCAALLASSIMGAACSDDGIDSNEAARRAYLGLDPSIAKSLTLGFAGFNSATSANIDPQMTTGTATGTLAITGQVDQGASDNKGMRLYVGMVDYSDGDVVIKQDGGDIIVHLTYDTSTVQTEQPFLSLSLRNIPTGTFTGMLTGTYHLQGDIAALDGLEVPPFDGTLVARYPIYTAPELPPPTIDLAPEVADAVDRVAR